MVPKFANYKTFSRTSYPNFLNWTTHSVCIIILCFINRTPVLDWFECILTMLYSFVSCVHIDLSVHLDLTPSKGIIIHLHV